MDPYLLIIKYIFEKNKKENVDSTLEQFFSNGLSFPQFISILYEIDQIPGVIVSKNKFQIANNNMKALSFLGQKNPFFSSYSINFNDLKNQQSLIQLILNKVYFKINRPNFLKKVNDFLYPFDRKISNFSEFIQGNGFMKILNAVSNGTIPSEIKVNNNDELINSLKQHFNSLNIAIVIDKSSLMPTNQDFLMYQALIIMDQFEKASPQLNEKLSKEIGQNLPDEATEVKTNSNLKVVSFDDSELTSIDSPKKNSSDNKIDHTQNIQSSNIDERSSNENNDDKQIKLGEQRNDSISSMSSSIFESSDILNLPKSSYLNIVNNYLEVHNKKGVLYFSDFEQGVILPILVELLLKEKIPNILEDPIGYDQLMNNMNTLYFIQSKDPLFSPRDFNMAKQDDIINLIRILFRKFVMTDQVKAQMSEECNRILQKYHQRAKNFNKDWDDGLFFVALLNFLSKGTIVFPPKEELDIDKLKDLFIKSNCMKVMENDAIFGNVDEFVIEYQVKLILDEIKNRKIEIPKYHKNDTKEKEEEVQSSNQEILDNDKYVYVKDSSPIIRVLNVIGQEIGLNYNSLDDIIDGMTLHILVEYLMNVPSIPNINPKRAFQKNNLITTLAYLKDNCEVFKQISCDFDDQAKKDDEIKLFAITLLNQFFLKESKENIVAKAGKILDKKIFIKDLKRVFLFGHSFYNIFGIKDVEIKNYYDEETLLATFQKMKVPFILDENSLTNINENYICYQLQLIFKIINVELDTTEEPIEIENNKNSDSDDYDNENDNDDDDDDRIRKFIKAKFFKFGSVLDKKNEVKSFKFDISSLTEDKKNPSEPKEQINKNEKKNPNALIENLDQIMKKIKETKKENKENQTVSPKIDEKQTVNVDDDKNILPKEDESSTGPYVPNIENYDEMKSQIDHTLDQLIKSALEEVNENELEGINKNFPSENTQKAYRLFDYKSKEWVYNKLMFPEFLRKNKIELTDILYLVLLPPSSISENDNLDPAYQIIKAMSASQTIEKQAVSNAHVEIAFGGDINDIRNRFGTHSISCQREFVAVMQLKYPISMKNDPSIINMQTILTLQADYILSLYPNMKIIESILYINTALYNAKQSPYFESKHIGLSQLLTTLPISIDLNSNKMINDRAFEKKLDDLINSDDDNFFKEIRNYYKYSNAKIQWIDINNHETYTNFLETVINFCQRKTSIQNKAEQYMFYFKKVCNINSISSEKDFSDLINDILKSYDVRLNEILFNYHYTENRAIFNKDAYEHFLMANKIDKFKDNLFIVLFIYSDPDDMNLISKMISKISINNANITNEILAEIKYCGLLDEIGNHYGKNIKDDLPKGKNHLAFISIKVPNDKDIDYFLQFAMNVRTICDLMVTISSDKNKEKQLSYFKKMNNLAYLYDKMPLSFKMRRNNELNHSCKNLFLYQSGASCKEEINIIEGELKGFNNCILIQQRNDSCANCISKIFDLLKISNNISKDLGNLAKDINENNLNLFIVKILQDITSIIKKERVFSITENDKSKTVKRVVDYICLYKDYSLTQINHEFILFYLPFVIDKELYGLSDVVMDIKQKITAEYVEYVAANIIDEFASQDLPPDVFQEAIDEYIKKSVVYINETQIEYFKKYLKQYMYNFYYEKVGESVSQNKNIYKDLVKEITDRLFVRINEKVQSVMNYIDMEYNKTKEYESKTIVLNEQQIKQNSMKYVLSVRESIRELTIEIECNDDLEKNIPLDC